LIGRRTRLAAASARQTIFKQAINGKFSRRFTPFTLSCSVPHRRNVYQPSGNMYTDILGPIFRLLKRARQTHGGAYWDGTHVALSSSLDNFFQEQK